MAKERKAMKCDTCGKTSARLRRDVLDANYNALGKAPLWNCDGCYEKKHRDRLADSTG